MLISFYVALDADVMDPSIAPGTGTHEPGGLRFEDIDQLLMALPAKGRVVGFDVVEVNPLRDPSGRTDRRAFNHRFSRRDFSLAAILARYSVELLQAFFFKSRVSNPE